MVLETFGDNHPLLCQIFPDSLTGLVATWYTRLEKTSSWKEIANSFLEYYRFNTKIASNRTVLKRIEKKSGKSFHEYAQRWHELAAQVQPPMIENEMIKWFIDNLKPPYYKKMISTKVTHFASLILIGEHIAKVLGARRSWISSLWVPWLNNKSRKWPATRLRKSMFIWLTIHQKGLRVLLLPMLP